MMKIFNVCTAVSLMLVHLTFAELRAQANAERPAGPLIQNKVPKFSAWEVTYKHTSPLTEEEEIAAFNAALNRMAEEDPVFAKQRAKGGLALGKPSRIQKKIFTKAGSTRLEQTHFTNGVIGERWQVEGRVVIHNPFSDRYIVRSADPNERDFPEFTWLNEGNYVGLKSFNGRSCMIFEDQVHPVLINDPRTFLDTDHEEVSEENALSVKAYIDVETRLPLGLEAGEQQMTYHMLPPPSAPLTFPPKFAKVLADVEERSSARNTMLAAP